MQSYKPASLLVSSNGRVSSTCEKISVNLIMRGKWHILAGLITTVATATKTNYLANVFINRKHCKMTVSYSLVMKVTMKTAYLYPQNGRFLGLFTAPGNSQTIHIKSCPVNSLLLFWIVNEIFSRCAHHSSLKIKRRRLIQVWGQLYCSIIHVCVCFFCVFHGLNRHGVHDRSELNAAIHDIFHNKWFLNIDFN